METFFYVIGAALVLIALVVSAIGMRRDDFPSPAVLRVGILFVALVVVVTGYAAVEASEEEELARIEEENVLADEAEAEATAENEQIVGGGTPEDEAEAEAAEEGSSGTTTTASADGAAVFVENSCGSCHTLAAQGDQALGETGPNLDEALVDKDAPYIETAIVDPGAVIAPGFGDGIMPSDFGEIIEPADLDALVSYLQESTSGSAK